MFHHYLHSSNNHQPQDCRCCHHSKYIHNHHNNLHQYHNRTDLFHFGCFHPGAGSKRSLCSQWFVQDIESLVVLLDRKDRKDCNCWKFLLQVLFLIWKKIVNTTRKIISSIQKNYLLSFTLQFLPWDKLMFFLLLLKINVIRTNIWNAWKFSFDVDFIVNHTLTGQNTHCINTWRLEILLKMFNCWLFCWNIHWSELILSQKCMLLKLNWKYYSPNSRYLCILLYFCLHNPLENFSILKLERSCRFSKIQFANLFWINRT